MMRIKTLLCCLSCLMFVAVANAQSVENFYNGLAEIIERNSNNPTQAVAEAKRYFQTNQATVQEIRRSATEALQNIDPDRIEQQRVAEPKMSPAGERYTAAIQRFTMAHPEAAMEIIALTAQLIPGMDGPIDFDAY